MDGDMRSPSLAQFAGIPNDHGTSNFLAGDDNVDRLIRTPEGLGFSIVPAGPHPPNAAELLTGSRLKLLMEELLKRHAHVVIDSPPGVGLADEPLIVRKSVVEGKEVAVR